MSKDDRTRFVSYCGVYCGACSLRLAGVEKDKRHLTEKAKTLEAKELKYWLACPGCRKGSHRADCDFRICARGRKLKHCVDCPEFPCKLHEEFNGDGVPHHSGSLASLAVLKDAGEEAWLGVQRAKWTCACGASLSWYLKSCLKCDRPGKPVK